MKQTIIYLLFSFLPFCVFSQIGISMGLGATGNPDNTLPNFKLSLSYKYENIYVETSEVVPISRNVEPGAIMGFTAGYQIVNNLYPVASFGYNLKSTDRKYLNGWITGAGLLWRKEINSENNSGIFCNAMIYQTGYYYISGGIYLDF